MELFCIAFAADCSNSAMQAAAVYSYIKTYLTLAENYNECDDDHSIYGCEDMELFCIAFAADCSNSAMQVAAVYSYIKTYFS